uniref:NAB domain-containing protein n=1 Tax=Oryza barthii TaxID=65489 RepID=A0A0D3ES15_9ORYZ
MAVIAPRVHLRVWIGGSTVWDSLGFSGISRNKISAQIQGAVVDREEEAFRLFLLSTSVYCWLGKGSFVIWGVLDASSGVDDNVENILRMIGEENESAETEPSDDSGNAFKKSKLSSLVKGFHEEYEYLHKHYQQLIGKLENVGHSSSDSDSSDSDDEGDSSDNNNLKTKVEDALSEENGWKQKLFEDREAKEGSLEAEIEKLKQNTEEQAKEISDLKHLLDKAIKDKEATRVELSLDVANLSSENENLKLLVETTEREAGESHKTITLMENEIRTLSVEKQVTEKERDDLKISIVDLENMNGDLSNQLQETNEKCTFLSSQLEKAQLAEKEVQTLLSEIEKIKNENLMLSRENDNLKACEQNLGTECSQLKATIAETKAENSTLTEEKHLLESKLKLLGVEIDDLIAEKEELMNSMNIERGAAAEEKEMLVSEHSKCLTELEKAQSSVKELESTNGDLNDKIAVLQNEKNSLSSELQQLEASFKNLGNDLEQELERISIMQKNNEDLELVNSNLQNDLATVQGQKNEAVASTLELGNKLEEKNQQISNLQEAVENLEAAKTNMYNEVTVHQEKCTFLSSQLEKAQLAEKEVQTLLSEIEKMKNENLMLSRENDNLKACEQNLGTECSQLKATIAETKAENSTLTEEKHLLESKLKLLGVEIDGLIAEKQELMNSMNIERGAAAEEKEMLVSEHSKCLTELEKAQSSVKELESTNGDLNDKIAVLQKEGSSLASELQQLEASFKNLGNDLEQKFEQISVMQKNNEELELANSNLQNELAMVQEQKNEAVASTVELGNKLEEQNQQISNLQEAVENLEAAKTDMYSELTVCQEEKNAALLQVQQLEANLKNLESELEQKQSQVSALEQANEELREKISSLERQLEEARSKLQDEIIKLQGEKERALDNLQQSNTSIKTFEEELEKQREHNSILQLANDDLHKSIANLEKELEDTKVSSHAEILALQEQKNKALSDLQQSEISIENFRMELEQGREKISILDLSNEEMKDNNYRLNQQLEEIRTSLHAEIAALHEEKDAAQLELQQSLASARNLETVLEKQTENLSTLQHANDNLKKNNCTLTEQFEVIKIELQEEVKMAHEEKDATLTQLEKSEDSIKNLESELAQLKEELSVQMESNSSLNKQLEEAILKVSNLTEELETVQAETASKINDMETNTKDLVNTIDLLSSQKNRVEEHMKIITEACMEKMSFMKDFEDQVKQKITDREIAIACLQQSLRGIIGSCQRLQYAYGEVSTKASHLEVLRRNHLVQIDTLENKHTEIMEKHRHLGEENTSANKENRKLQNHVQELEAQLQLARQKLRVTEAESKSKEDSYVMAVEKSHREIQYLEQKIQKYSGQINSLEETLVQIKGNAESGTSTLVDQLDQLESHFNKSFTHFSARSFACSEELKLLRNRLQHHLAEQKELVKKNDVLGMRLREKENVLSEMVRSASEAKKKMAHLEKTIDEKEEEISARVQEKREAIKQLSNAIIYHKNNSDDLIRYIRNHNRRRLPFCL